MTRDSNGQRTGSIRGSREPVQPLLAPSAVGASLYVIVRLFLDPSQQQELVRVFTSTAANLLLLFVLQLSLWSLVRLVAPFLPGAGRTGVLTGIAVFGVVLAAFLGVSDHLAALQPTRAVTLAGSGIVLASLCGLGTGALLPRVVEPPPRGRSRLPSTAALTSATIAIALLCVGFAWLLVFQIDTFDDGSGLPTVAAMGAWLLFLSACAAMSWGAVRRPPLEIQAGAIALLAVSVMVFSWSAWSRRPGHSLTGRAEGDGPPAHILLIVVDTLRADAVGAYRPGTSGTPELDDLAEDSVLFLEARSPSPWTKPAMASMLSGLPVLAHGTTATDSVLPEALTTLAEYLRDAGYATAAFVGNPHLQRRFRFDQGFEEHHFVPGSPVLRVVGAATLRRLSGRDSNEPVTEILVDSTVRFFEAAGHEPSFVLLHIMDPHAPYSPPTPFRPSRTPPAGLDYSFGAVHEARAGIVARTTAERHWIKELYDAEVRYVDRQLGRLFAALERLQVYEDTLIVLTSDHGEEFWERDGAGHGHSLYDELLRVPLLFKLPGHRVGRTVDSPVSTQAVTPTILELAGIQARTEILQTASLTSRLLDPSASPSAEPLFSTGMLFFQDREAVVFDGMKFIRDLETGDEELYSLEEDPGERRSMVVSRPELVEHARKLLSRQALHSLELRERLGLSNHPTVLPAQLLRQLRSLGYLR